MTAALVLDASGLDALQRPQGHPQLRAALRRAIETPRDVLVPTLVLAELARGRARTAALESLLRRDEQVLQLVDTDPSMAKLVGAILHGAEAGSEDIVDAHVVAAAVAAGGALVVTDDAGDIHRLADAVPAVRIITMRPDDPGQR